MEREDHPVIGGTEPGHRDPQQGRLAEIEATLPILQQERLQALFLPLRGYSGPVAGRERQPQLANHLLERLGAPEPDELGTQDRVALDDSLPRLLKDRNVERLR